METVTMSIWVLGTLIAVALAFDFMNGFHDGANSISTIVATGALTPSRPFFSLLSSTSPPCGYSSSRWRRPSARALSIRASSTTT